jgi:hypothetical protein
MECPNPKEIKRSNSHWPFCGSEKEATSGLGKLQFRIELGTSLDDPSHKRGELRVGKSASFHVLLLLTE